MTGRRTLKATLVALCVLVPAGVAVALWSRAARPRRQTAMEPPRARAPAHSPAPAPAPGAAPSARTAVARDAGPSAPTLSQRLRSNTLLAAARAASNAAHKRELYEQALAEDPYNVDALRELAAIDLNDERYDQAERLARRCLAVDPSSKPCLTTLRWRFTRTGDFDAAAPLFEDCLDQVPISADCLAFAGGAALRRGDLKAAADFAARLDQAAPDSPDALALRGALDEQQGDPAAARRAYQQACDRGLEFACDKLARQR